MPTFAASPDAQLHYLVDDFTEPWTQPETILLLHGNCESSLAWYAWVPLLARRFRVVRPDMRGYGASTPMPRDFKWSLDVIIDDYARLMDSLGVKVFHLVGANPGPKISELASRDGIKISANLPDLRPAVCAGQVYVCAIRHGTGLKSKMLEAMAMQMPIVGYPGAVVGLAGTPGTHYLVAQDPKEFADHVVALLEQPERAGRLAQAGRELVEQEYSWESRARVYEDLYQTVMKERELRSRH